ncbi:MAG: hypothetical protein ACPGRX_02975 [Bdellovibrionales bacterium]
MDKSFENIPASEVSAVLLKNGVPPDAFVHVTVDDQETRRRMAVDQLCAAAQKNRAYAASQGMNETLFEELMKDES